MALVVGLLGLETVAEATPKATHRSSAACFICDKMCIAEGEGPAPLYVALLRHALLCGLQISLCPRAQQLLY